MASKTFFQKIQYYSDFELFVHVWKVSRKIDSLQEEALLPFFDEGGEKNFPLLQYTVGKLYHFVSLCSKIRKWIGFEDSCLKKSLLLGRILKEGGFEPKLNFGTKKTDSASGNEWSTVGHCWVSLEDEKTEPDYPFVVQYP